ncbi:Hypothetical protein I595_942 [Croceitalea dokdonensis DOKDO 023]|uniref:DUF7737 domain-containing protein n=1 Tax=Croceitalea dokdonensis DOKDO 023 TaxID=1300341 RepID=A0A0N8H467_9FLAO|nr:hypothetical protein [Croceitalea dokdonensis]KPM32524.1 Hypothetical protein I595_942 [Croceitalea dokdonensis DOKDO 023]
MISKQQAATILKGKRKQDFKDETFGGFSKPYQILGKLVVGKLPKYRDTTPMISYYSDAFGKDYKINPWQRGKVLIFAESGMGLGSANVSKGGLALNIIPVHSQHCGRMFLPFVDDDPKTAELISKMKLLAEDHKIQDPTVMAQIHKG